MLCFEETDYCEVLCKEVNEMHSLLKQNGQEEGLWQFQLQYCPDRF